MNEQKMAQWSVKSGLLGFSKISGKTLNLSIAVLVALIVGNLAALYSSLRTVREYNRTVTQSYEVLQRLDQALLAFQDLENGGLTQGWARNDLSAQPSQTQAVTAIEVVRILKLLTENDPGQHRKADNLWEKSVAFMKIESALADILRRSSGNDTTAASQIPVLKAQAKGHMDEIRLIVQDMNDTENRRLLQRSAQAETAAYRQELSIVAIAGVSILLVLLVQYYIRRSLLLHQGETQRLNDENWQKTGMAEASAKLRGKESLEELGRSALEFFAQYLGMQVGAFYVLRHGDLQLTATYGKAGSIDGVPSKIRLSESLAGESIRNNRLMELDSLPDNYIKISSALGETVPRKLVILPLQTEDEQQVGVVEMGFLNALPKGAHDLFNDLKGSLSVAVTSALARQMQQDLLEETQRQAEELAAQQEELRASNEKLESQTSALRSSQERLQVQQEELRQTNEELEQQARAVEQQKQKLAEKNETLQAAKTELELKTRQLEQASRYKSEFLANMSHELRTPLNSLLLLTTLLAENKENTLTEKQVDFAKTIFKSGRDLLALINDILDLSKVEAGHLDLVREELDLDDLVSNLEEDFQLTAKEKGLNFEIQRLDKTPQQIITDPQRILQIMKNLISNALKFTPAGRVTVTIDRGEGPVPILFKVSDTGIGIASDKQNLIFEAFKQSDGSINRTYGGTGLGLTISRELAYLLGGHITVESKPMMGSTFTLHLPEVMPLKSPQDARSIMPNPPQAAASEPLPIVEPFANPPPETSEPVKIPQLNPDDRLVLIVEDDVVFSRIVADIAHEAGFKTILTSKGEEALQIAQTYPVNAALLDIKLPDMSGLGILERLKSDPATRHIPIHVISGTDYSRNALALGAIGYLQKPARPQDLRSIFDRIEAALSKKMKRLLLVEDDKIQRQATKELLNHGDIEIVEAKSGAEARTKLGKDTYDCIVLDLRLPDISGFELLEVMEREVVDPKPPIVVYTAKDLTRDEQELLERYAKSIVIKGARSPERLLDEVSLFLHHLESSLPPQSQTLLQKMRSDAIGLKGRRILLVDDDMRNVYALVNALESSGLKIIVARNGRESLSQLEQDESIELVLMDIMMPEMDGYEAMSIIRQNPRFKKLPIIALTAKAMKGDLEQCLAVGANDYLPKPINLERLLSLMRVWLPQKI